MQSVLKIIIDNWTIPTVPLFLRTFHTGYLKPCVLRECLEILTLLYLLFQKFLQSSLTESDFYILRIFIIVRLEESYIYVKTTLNDDYYDLTLSFFSKSVFYGQGNCDLLVLWKLPLPRITAIMTSEVDYKRLGQRP